MGYLSPLYLLFLSILLSTSASSHANPTLKGFLECMTIHSSGFDSTSTFLHTPSSPQYLSLLQSSQQNPRWSNSTTTPKPLSIITPYSEHEIQSTILCTKYNGLQIRTRSGGHDYEGLSFLCKTPFVIIDLINLRSITINMEHETAWVQSGATLGELYYSIAQRSGVHGFPAGICPSVGIGGHFSGGGFGTMVRKFGLAADNVMDARLVDVYGRVLDRKTMGEDLFWAIRGGGGASFGVIVSWKIKLVRVPPIVTVFNVGKTLDEGATKLVHRWQQVADKLHEDLFVRVIIQDANGELQSKGNKTVEAFFNSLFLGTTNELMTHMNHSFPELGLQTQDCTEMTWIESTLYFAGYPRNQTHDALLNRTTLYKSYFKAKSDFVKEPIPTYGLQGIWERFLVEDLVFLIMDPYGGRMSEIAESELPFPHRKGNLYNMQYLVKWDVNRDRITYKHVEWIKMVYKYMEPYVSHSPRGAYINYRDLDLGTNEQGRNTSYKDAKVWGEKYFKGNFMRLARVKSNVDPDNFFRNEQSIPPFYRIKEKAINK